MNFTELLKSEAKSAFQPTYGMLRMLQDRDLSWKPATGSNWMTVGQLLLHLTTATGFCCRGFLTGEWGMPSAGEGEADPAAMLPPAEVLPSVKSVAEAKALIEADEKLTYRMIDEAGEESLQNRMLSAPWAPGVDLGLGQHYLHMIHHHLQHKGQLFYYLKLMGKPVDTNTLWEG